MSGGLCGLKFNRSVRDQMADLPAKPDLVYYNLKLTPKQERRLARKLKRLGNRCLINVAPSSTASCRKPRTSRCGLIRSRKKGSRSPKLAHSRAELELRENRTFWYHVPDQNQNRKGKLMYPLVARETVAFLEQTNRSPGFHFNVKPKVNPVDGWKPIPCAKPSATKTGHRRISLRQELSRLKLKVELHGRLIENLQDLVAALWNAKTSKRRNVR